MKNSPMARKKRHRECKEQRRLYETEMPASEEHLMRLANQAVTRARIPPEIMSREECLDSALYGIAVGWKRYNPNIWQSSLEWLSMQAYYQVKSDCKKKLKTLNRENGTDDLEWVVCPRSHHPLDAMAREEAAAKFNALLSVLPKRDRAIVTRIAVMGETFKAVAKRHRLKRGEVMRLYAASLDKLRAVVEKSGFDTETE